jgi:hypothetical protein
MRKNTKLFLLVSAVLGISFVLHANAQDKPALREGKNPAIDVTRVHPSPADLRRIQQKRQREAAAGLAQAAAGEEQVHVIRLYVKMPPPTDKAAILYIGDTKINEYGGFSEGIFFKSYDRKELESWKGKPVRFVYNNETIELGVAVPPGSGDNPNEPPAKLPELRDVLKTRTE